MTFLTLLTTLDMVAEGPPSRSGAARSGERDLAQAKEQRADVKRRAERGRVFRRCGDDARSMQAVVEAWLGGGERYVDRDGARSVRRQANSCKQAHEARDRGPVSR